MMNSHAACSYLRVGAVGGRDALFVFCCCFFHFHYFWGFFLFLLLTLSFCLFFPFCFFCFCCRQRWMGFGARKKRVALGEPSTWQRRCSSSSSSEKKGTVVGRGKKRVDGSGWSFLPSKVARRSSTLSGGQ
ncbi:hypothetical protein TCDM_07863 [Trypanosoma cruzi Dm28c]|uniref:Uncharacterized protein n=1 Tax=Trypanosoma cruzi Dm28c TaxID=1416333 RepID=V5B938_TRYCR|nr:hypothetical protein TCDM_07863 [Trypanosoma cruzi Dm28c]